MKLFTVLFLVFLSLSSFAESTYWHKMNEAKCVGRTTLSEFSEVKLKLLKADFGSAEYGADLPGGGTVHFVTRSISFSHSSSTLSVTFGDFTAIESSGLVIGEDHYMNLYGTTGGVEKAFNCFVDISIGYNL